jgi:hypothetical protein
MTTAFLWTVFLMLAGLVVLAMLVGGIKRLLDRRGGGGRQRQFHDH